MAKPKLYSMFPLVQAAEQSTIEGKPASIGAFNVNFYTQAEGILEGLKRADAPAIIQASKGANSFQGGPDKIQYMILKAMEKMKVKVPICLHLDHGDYEAAAQCIAKGFSSVMIDYSTKKSKDKDGKTKEDKRSVEENCYLTRPIVLAAHEKGISVEGEMGVLAGQEEDIIAEKSIYPTPQEVLDYSMLAGVDAVAVACGTCHGPIKKFKKLEIELLQESYRLLRENNLKTIIVLHGSSTVPPELIAEINAHGGNISAASGVPMEQIKKAVQVGGVRKINIDTDLRLAITSTLRKYFHDNPGVEQGRPYLTSIKDILFGVKQGIDPKTKLPVDSGKIIDPRVYLADIPKEVLRESPKGTELEEVMAIIKERIAKHVEMLVNEFGSAGLAPKVEKKLTLERMIKKYKSKK